MHLRALAFLALPFLAPHPNPFPALGHEIVEHVRDSFYDPQKASQWVAVNAGYADAVADPLTGLVAADACLAALATGQRTLVDLAMAGVASTFTGPALPIAPGVEAVEPSVVVR